MIFPSIYPHSDYYSGLKVWYFAWRHISPFWYCI